MERTVDDGLNGERGSLRGYGSRYGIVSASWNAQQAQAVIYNMLNGTTHTTWAATTFLRIGEDFEGTTRKLVHPDTGTSAKVSVKGSTYTVTGKVLMYDRDTLEMAHGVVPDWQG